MHCWRVYDANQTACYQTLVGASGASLAGVMTLISHCVLGSSGVLCSLNVQLRRSRDHFAARMVAGAKHDEACQAF